MLEIIVGLVKFLVELLNDKVGESSRKIFLTLIIISLALNAYLVEKVLYLAEVIYVDVTDEVNEAMAEVKTTNIKKSE